MKWTPEDVFRQPRAGLCAELKDVTQHTQDQRDSDLAGESDRAQKPGRGVGWRRNTGHVPTCLPDNSPEIRSCRAVTGAQPSG